MVGHSQDDFLQIGHAMLRTSNMRFIVEKDTLNAG